MATLVSRLGARPARVALALAILAGAAGCTLVVDTSGLVGGESAGQTAGDASLSDARAPSKGDGAVGPTSDAGAAVDAPDAASSEDTGPPCTVTCDQTNAATTTCSGAQCAYTCATGWGDCNATTGSDSDGCETPIDTTLHCGACGVACDTKTGTPTCEATGTCAYACKKGRADCNAAGSNVDGCECASPTCCGTGCAIAHSDGVGDTFYDCADAGPPTLAGALAACAAYTGNPSLCSGDWTCNGTSTISVCYDKPDGGGCGDYCWNYSGADNGIVTDCTCPGNKQGPWN